MWHVHVHVHVTVDCLLILVTSIKEEKVWGIYLKFRKWLMKWKWRKRFSTSKLKNIDFKTAKVCKRSCSLGMIYLIQISTVNTSSSAELPKDILLRQVMLNLLFHEIFILILFPYRSGGWKIVCLDGSYIAKWQIQVPRFLRLKRISGDLVNVI